MGDNSWMWVLAVLLVFAGLAGTVLPALPGVPLVFAGLLLAAWADGFVRVGPLTLTLLGVLTALALRDRTRRGGARREARGSDEVRDHRRGAGTFTGIFFGVPGLLLGPFAGAVAGELVSHGRWPQAARAGMATWVGLLFGTLVKIALVFTMIGIFAAAWFL